MKPIIFFDIDNTLLDHHGADKKAVQKVRQKHFPKVSTDDFLSVWKEASKKYWKLFEEKHLTFEQQRIKRIQDIWAAFGKKITEGKASLLFSEYLILYESSWSVFPDMVHVPEELTKQDISLGIISNGSLIQQIKKLTKTHILSFFDRNLMFISEEVGFAKPDIRLFQQVQKIAKRDPLGIFFFGDDLKQDIMPALSLGWQAILVDHNKNHEAFKGKRVISGIEVLQLISSETSLHQ